MAKLTMPWIQGLYGLAASSTEDDVCAKLEETLTQARNAQAHGAKLEADLSAVTTRAAQAEAQRDALLKAAEQMPPAPEAPAAKFKAGDKVLYREAEATIKSVMGPEFVYEFETGECGPESRCQPMEGAVAKAFAANLQVLTFCSVRVPGHTVSAEQLRSLAMQAATGAVNLPDAIKQIEASVPKDSKQRQANNAAAAMLQPEASATPKASEDPLTAWSSMIASAR